MTNTLVQQRIFQNKLNTTRMTKASIKFNEKVKELERAGRDLADVKGIGPKTIEILYKEGIKTTEQLKVLSEEWLRNKLPHLSVMHVLDFINKENEKGISEQSQATD